MANVLSMAKINGILGLHREGWSQRRIAEALGIDRKTVAAYLAAEEAKRATAPTGKAPTGSVDSKWAKAPTGSELSADAPSDQPSTAAEPSAVRHVEPLGGVAPAPAEPATGRVFEGEENGACAESVPALSAPATELRTESAAAAEEHREAPPAASSDSPSSRSLCSTFQAVIEAKLAQGLTAQRIHQDLVDEHGFTGQYPSVRRFVSRLNAGRPLPFRRIEVPAGEEAQVDFGTGATLVLPDGRRRKTHVFRIVLSHSRKAYSEVVDAQTTEKFIRALENAFHAFGGRPLTLVIDNLRAAVHRADWYEPELNPKMRSFCEHYEIAVLPTRPRMPRHKGKVERGVDYVQENALKGRRFNSLREQNEHLRAWEANIADKRIHGTTKKQVGQVFEEHERPALKPLPRERFPCFEEGPRRVHRDGHVEVAKAYYSAPPEYVGHQVWVRWNEQTVRLFNQRFEQISLHTRREPGQFSTLSAHIVDEKITGVERGAEWLLRKISLVGPQARRWGEAMLAARGIEGVRVLQGLLALTKKHRSEQLEAACESAWRHQAYQLRTVRKLLERREAEQQVFEFIDEHPLIRSLSEYGQFVHESIQGGL